MPRTGDMGGMITDDSRLELFKIVRIGKTSTWESRSQSSGSQEEFAKVGLNSPQWNTEGGLPYRV